MLGNNANARRSSYFELGLPVVLLSLTFALCSFVKFGKIVIWELQLEIKPYTDLPRWNASRRDKFLH